MEVTLIKTKVGYIPANYDLSKGHTLESLRALPAYSQVSIEEKDDLDTFNRHVIATTAMMLAPLIPHEHYDAPERNPMNCPDWPRIKDEVLNIFGATIVFDETLLTSEQEDKVVKAWEEFAEKYVN